MGTVDVALQSRGSAASLLRDTEGRIDLRSFDLVGITKFFKEELDEGATRARNVYKALWQQNARTFADIQGVARPCMIKLMKKSYLPVLEPELVLRSTDGSVKYLWKCEDGYTIESVLIPDGERLTLCMSSQVGCAMACAFCLTGDIGLKRHLKPSEIALQPMLVQQDLEAFHGARGEAVPRITNLVLMGMGEPLHNLDNLVTALRTCLNDDGLNFSHRKVTVSTVGLVPRMGELAAQLPVNLAVSLNATTEEQRRQIMPITRRHSLQELMQACRDFPMPKHKRITFEYVMFSGFNDTLEDAARLEALLQGIPSKINLIPYNENPDRSLRRPPEEVVKAFQHYFVSRGWNCTVRTTRGIDISAACGQLGKTKQQVEERGWVAEWR